MKCTECNQELQWRSDTDNEELYLEGEGIVSDYRCQNEKCKVTHIVIYTSTKKK